MNTLYFDCSMGAAGDMLSASLLELFPDRDATAAELNALGIPKVRFIPEKAVKCGVIGTHMRVSVDGVEEGDEPREHVHPHGHYHEHGQEHPHAHSSLADIRSIVAGLALPEAVREDILAVYESIAGAESAVHGTEVSQIHFHEVGTMDAVADITAFCYLLRKLNPDKVMASPIHVGSGQVRCAHGILPVPAPATALLLRGVPIYGGEIKGELCTPTGAALLAHFVTEFGPIPLMRPERIGCGMGKKDFPAANCIRAIWGRWEKAREEDMYALSCNLDDMTPEAIGYACQVLRDAGAPEVFTTPAAMKKDRPGVVLTVICRPDRRREMAELLLRHTSTIGVRETALRRYVLDRTVETVDTPFGPVRKKVSVGYGVRREKYEFDDLARIAREQSLPLLEVQAELEKR